MDDALRIRRRILLAFERAENGVSPAERERLMTIVVVGGGPTGVELAGAFAELTRRVLKRDFRQIDPRQARVILTGGRAAFVASIFGTTLDQSGGATGEAWRRGANECPRRDHR